jgi:glycosyltransferase involved in cell wall biosynthesis
LTELIAVSSNSTSSSSLEIPKLSILLATKDQAATLERCLQGIQDQLFSDYEFLILNDGSTDRTSAILANWAQQDSRIRVFEHHGPLGVIAAAHFLLGHARGDFIWHAASDDFCVDPYFLQEGFRLHATFPQAAGFFCNTLRVIMPENKPHGVWGTTGGARFIPQESFLISVLKGSIIFPGCAAVIKRVPFEKEGGFDKKAGPLCDMLTNIRLGLSLGFVFTNSTSMHSTVYADKSNFGTSFSAWQQLHHLVYLEAKVRESLAMEGSILEQLFISFRYLYLGKIFNLEHKFRHAQKGFSCMKSLLITSTKILTEYESSLNMLGFKCGLRMSAHDFLRHPSRNPVRRFFQRLRKSLFRTQEISL